MYLYSRRFYCFELCFAFFFLNRLSTERRGSSSDAVPTLGLEGVHRGGPSLVTHQVYAHDASKWEQIVTPFAASSGGGNRRAPAPARRQLNVSCLIDDVREHPSV